MGAIQLSQFTQKNKERGKIDGAVMQHQQQKCFLRRAHPQTHAKQAIALFTEEFLKELAI